MDFERRQVVDVLADRSADSTAEWLRGHPEVEMVSRTGLDSAPKVHGKERHRRAKSRIGFICS